METLVDTVATAPAAVGDGFVKAQEAVSSAGELLESIPRTVQDIPAEVRATRVTTAARLAYRRDVYSYCCR